MPNSRHVSLLKIINDTPLPPGRNLTPQAKQTYEQGKAVMNTFRGQTEILVEALQYFYRTDSMPYACAGIASVLERVSFLHDDKYDADGLAEALRWAENAEELAPDHPELKLPRANIYINMKRLDEAGVLLDRLRPVMSDAFDFFAVEMYYWRQRKNSVEVLAAFNNALPLATEAQKQNQYEALAGHYMEMKNYPHAIESYKEIIKRSPENPWAWHNISVMLYRQKHYREALRYNQEALKRMNFGAAHQMTELIGKKMTWWDRLLMMFNL